MFGRNKNTGQESQEGTEKYWTPPPGGEIYVYGYPVMHGLPQPDFSDEEPYEWNQEELDQLDREWHAPTHEELQANLDLLRRIGLIPVKGESEPS